MPEVNVVTVVLIGGFFWPIFSGAFERFSPDRLKNSVQSLVDGMEFLFAFLLAMYLTRQIFFDHKGIFSQIYSAIPQNFREILYGQDLIIYVLVVPLLIFPIHSLLKLLTLPFNLLILEPFSRGLGRFNSSLGSPIQRLMGALSQLPRAVLGVLLLTLLLTFVSYYFPSAALSSWMNSSRPYQLVYHKAVTPVLNSNIAKQIPVLIYDSFAQTAERVQLDESADHPTTPNQNRPRVITYFNGVTLDEAIKSNAQIDATARHVVGNETDSKRKAYLLYQWVSQNIIYDYDKAAAINRIAVGADSGSIIAYNTRRGICFDYASLYISMCRATGIKVRLITGLGYSGTAWGDHAWNQIYSPEDTRWINVDPTFGINGRYFDKPDFKIDHRYAEVQGEW